MKWQTKLNQFSVYKGENIKDKAVDAYIIDVNKKCITETKIIDSIEYLQKSLDFFNWTKLDLKKDNTIIIVGMDADLKTRNSFTVLGFDHVYYGHAAVVKTRAHGYPDQFKNISIDKEYIETLIKFNKDE